jgi:hypothetical protein
MQHARIATGRSRCEVTLWPSGRLVAKKWTIEVQHMRATHVCAGESRNLRSEFMGG